MFCCSKVLTLHNISPPGEYWTIKTALLDSFYKSSTAFDQITQLLLQVSLNPCGHICINGRTTWHFVNLRKIYDLPKCKLRTVSKLVLEVESRLYLNIIFQRPGNRMLIELQQFPFNSLLDLSQTQQCYITTIARLKLLHLGRTWNPNM